ncbi:hypothetical protein M3J09_000493 [Ascochyta lentis]
MSIKQSTRSQATLNTRTSLTITSAPSAFAPDDETCIGSVWTLTPSGYDGVTIHTSIGRILTRGFDPSCYPPDFGPGVIYSPARCPNGHVPATKIVNTYNATRTVTTFTCCPDFRGDWTLTSVVTSASPSCFTSNTGKNIRLLGWTVTDNFGPNDGPNIITADAWMARYVAVAYESSDAPRLGLSPTTTSASTLVLNSTAPATSSPSSTAATPTSSLTTDKLSARPRLSTGTIVGIVIAAIVLAVALVVSTLLFYRRKSKRHKTRQSEPQEVYFKAELPGDGKPHTELDETNAMREADGYSKPPEADSSHAIVELESDWTGWEASALLEVELSRNMQGNADMRGRQPGQRSMMRNSILQTPIDMVRRNPEQ